MTEDETRKKAELKKIRIQGFMLRLANDPNFRVKTSDSDVPTRILLIGTHYVICSVIKDSTVAHLTARGFTRVFKEPTSKIWIAEKGVHTDPAYLLENGPEEIKDLIIYNMGLFK